MFSVNPLKVLIEAISKLSKGPSKQNPRQVVKGKVCVCIILNFKIPSAKDPAAVGYNAEKQLKKNCRTVSKAKSLALGVIWPGLMQWSSFVGAFWWNARHLWMLDIHYKHEYPLSYLLWNDLSHCPSLISLLAKSICSLHISVFRTVVNSHASPALGGAGAVHNLKSSDPVMC